MLSYRPKSSATASSTNGFSQLEGQHDKTRNAGIRKKFRTSLTGVREIPETPQQSFTAVDADVDMTESRVEHFEDTPVRKGRAVIFRGNGDGASIAKEIPETPARSDEQQVGFVKSHSVFPNPSVSPIALPSSSPMRLDKDGLDDIRNVDSDGDEDISDLHWQDDEITGHDPSDPEDDGTGINGIGFRPTPAMARSRAEKRRRQMAEYKSREEREAREARAKRSAARRRGQAEQERGRGTSEEERRRVRFEEKERAIDVL